MVERRFCTMDCQGACSFRAAVDGLIAGGGAGISFPNPFDVAAAMQKVIAELRLQAEAASCSETDYDPPYPGRNLL